MSQDAISHNTDTMSDHISLTNITSNVTSQSSPVILSDHSGKRANQGRGAPRSQSYSGSQTYASFSTSAKINLAAAMVGMQAQIGRLIDVFEKSITAPEDGRAAQCSLAIARLQEIDDKLSMDDMVKLIGLFQKDMVIAQTYLDLINDNVCQAWLCSILDG